MRIVFCDNRRWHKFHLDFESMKLVAADVLSFGILLLRLVCRKSIPQDNRMLIKWVSTQSFPTLHCLIFHGYFECENTRFCIWKRLIFGLLTRNLYLQAQPLLQERAYPEMLDEEEEYTDIHGMFRLMCAAAQCIKSRHTARPSMSEVIYLLKQKNVYTLSFPFFFLGNYIYIWSCDVYSKMLSSFWGLEVINIDLFCR